MKITFVMACASLAGGDRVIAIYAERLKKRGHEVFVVAFPPSKPSLREQVRSLLKEGLMVILFLLVIPQHLLAS